MTCKECLKYPVNGLTNDSFAESTELAPIRSGPELRSHLSYLISSIGIPVLTCWWLLFLFSFPPFSYMLMIIYFHISNYKEKKGVACSAEWQISIVIVSSICRENTNTAGVTSPDEPYHVQLSRSIEIGLPRVFSWGGCVVVFKSQV
ncbi:hypothetical protein BDV25DRAFT_153446 [Aspergillus avenaceus]|uniref:Uncharacterized protein n=1 Tax=Aspergillus avenaceus TaxID=36643 RepID=A0A5N6TXB4_ASPAV|nr:hypothetical protein BDV25DRAFT_153446 [Aspergillus avenaceus]